MTDEYYQKKRLEEMQKQTECMENQAKALCDIRDALVGMSSIFLTGIADNPNTTRKNFDLSKSAMETVKDAIEKRWSE